LESLDICSTLLRLVLNCLCYVNHRAR